MTQMWQPREADGHLSSIYVMDLRCLGWAQVGVSNLTVPHSCQARCGWERGPGTCRCPGAGLWLFDPAVGRVLHPWNREGCPGAPREFGREQGMTNWGGACVLLTQ